MSRANWEFWDLVKVMSVMNNNTLGIRFIVVIGDGGVGKSTVVNVACNLNPDQGTAVNGLNSTDGTISFCGIFLPDLKICYIDTPGCYYDEVEWWKVIQQLTHVHGYIILANMQRRNAGYKSLGYVYLQLSLNHPTKVKWFCLGNPKDMVNLSTDNYSYNKPHADVLLDVNSEEGIVHIRSWAQGISASEYVGVFNPLQLIGQLKRMESELDQIKSAAKDMEERLESDKKQLIVEKHLMGQAQLAKENELTSAHNLNIEKYVDRITAFKSTLTKLDTDESKVGVHNIKNHGLDSHAPSRCYYIFAWCPCLGSYWLGEHIRRCNEAVDYGHSVRMLRKSLNEKE